MADLIVTTAGIRIAAQVIAGSSRSKPADGVLRERLKSERGLSPQDARAASGLVFAYYRWFGWLEGHRAVEERIREAVELQEQFRRELGSFSDEEMMTRAVPGFINLEMEVSAEWGRVLQAEPKLWLRARRGRGEALAAKLGDCRAFGEGALSDILRYNGREDLFRTPEFHAGEFEIQDISSQAVGLVCAPAAKETWWDACAGEGGKTLHLSDLMENKGLIWATDLAEWRLQRLKRRAARAGVFNFRSRTWDGSAKLPVKTKFDGVLLDAPCSGVGTWQRNPHARWTLTAQDIRELAELQQRLLAHVAESVKPGGRLIYAVCTLTRAETTGVADEFDKRADFERMEIRNPLEADAPSRNSLMLWPQNYEGNGMFIAAWRKRSANSPGPVRQV